MWYRALPRLGPHELVQSHVIVAAALWQDPHRIQYHSIATVQVPQNQYSVANTTVARRLLSPTPMWMAWHSRPVIQNKRVCTCPAWADETNCHADSVSQGQCYRAPSQHCNCHAGVQGSHQKRGGDCKLSQMPSSDATAGVFVG